jgi:hypothetical protein
MTAIRWLGPGAAALAISLAACGSPPPGASTLHGASALQDNPGRQSAIASSPALAPPTSAFDPDEAGRLLGALKAVMVEVSDARTKLYAAAGPTGVAPGKSFGAVQEALEASLTARQNTLSQLSAEISSAGNLTPADSSALRSTLAATTSGIDALAAKAPMDTSLTELVADEASMSRNLRVDHVVAPQVDLTVAADTLTAAEANLADFIEQARALLPPPTSQMGPTDAEPYFVDLVSQNRSASGLTEGITGDLLAQSPGGYPSNQAVFMSAIDNLSSAVTDLHTAVEDVVALQKALRTQSGQSGKGGLGANTAQSGAFSSPKATSSQGDGRSVGTVAAEDG